MSARHPRTSKAALEQPGTAPVCPTCGAPLDFRTDPLGYGVTIEQCSRGYPACDHWRPLSTRRATKAASRARIWALLPADPAGAATPAELAEAIGVSVSFVKLCLTDLRAEGRAAYRAHQVPGKIGRPAHRWWRRA